MALSAEGAELEDGRERDAGLRRSAWNDGEQGPDGFVLFVCTRYEGATKRTSRKRSCSERDYLSAVFARRRISAGRSRWLHVDDCAVRAGDALGAMARW